MAHIMLRILKGEFGIQGHGNNAPPLYLKDIGPISTFGFTREIDFSNLRK